MTNIYGALNTARVSILTQQTGIEVTGQNLANVNTQGYSRQTLRMEANSPVMAGNAAMGTGVRLTEIKREADGFITSQLNDSASKESYYKATNQTLSTLETIFNESDNRGLGNNIDRFFNSFHDLSVNAKGITERSAVISTANLMANTMRALAGDVSKTKNNVESQIQQSVSQINVLTSEIAVLNKNIHAVEANNVFANDLRDKRDEKIKTLAQYMDINAYEDTGSKQMMITTSQGKQLVLGDTAYQLETSTNGNNNGLVDLNINDGRGNRTNITSEINSGSLSGFLYLRDTVIPDYQSRLDKLAAGIVREVNRLHSSGYDLNRNPGVNFFNSLDVTARVNVNNAGNASISGAVAQQGFVSTDDYQVDITGAGAFTLFNVTTGASSGAFTFTSGTPVDLGNGLRITLTGAAQAGDQFTFSSSENAAIGMKVNSTVANDTNRVAAGTSTYPGDGSNAYLIAGLKDSLVFQGDQLLAGSGAVTFQDYYGALVGDVGVESMMAQQGVTHQAAIQTQLFTQRENIAGVNIDEEMVNIIRFQQAYNASARMITTINEMLDILQKAV